MIRFDINQKHIKKKTGFFQDGVHFKKLDRDRDFGSVVGICDHIYEQDGLYFGGDGIQVYYENPEPESAE